jgi:SOS-response transcriptional repressor LexA
MKTPRNIDRGSFIRKTRKKLNLSQLDIAEALNVTRTSVTKWEQGAQMKGESLIKLADFLNIDPNLLGGLPTPQKNPTIMYKSNDRSVIIREFPLLDKTEIMDWLSKKRRFDMEKFQIPMYDEKLSNDVYLLINEGNAMLNQDNPFDSIFPKEILVIEPNATPQDGCIVLVHFGKDDIRVRQYREDGSEKFLKAFDPNFKIIPLDNELKILGIVIYTIKRRF